MDRDDVIKKVQDCWRLADHPNTPEHEKALAIDTAKRLMAKYQIEQITLNEASATKEAVVLRSFRVEEQGRPAKVREQRIALGHQIAVHNRCRAIIEHREMSADVKTGKAIPGGVFLTVCGYESDCQMVESLYWSLVMSLMEALMDEVVQTRNYQENFASGFVTRISERLREMNREVHKVASEDEGGSMALVLVGREKQVEDTFTRMFPNVTTRRVSSKTKYDPNANERGRNKANVVDMGDKERVTSGDKPAIGS